MPKIDTPKVAAIAKIPAAPGKRDELIDALQIALDNAQGESGTLQYILHEDSKDPDAVWFYELYTDQDALTAHSTSDGFKAIGAAIGALVGGRPEITFLKPVGGKGL